MRLEDVELGSEVECRRLVGSEQIDSLPEAVRAYREEGHIGRVQEISFAGGFVMVTHQEFRDGKYLQFVTAFLPEEIEPYTAQTSGRFKLHLAIERHRRDLIDA